MKYYNLEDNINFPNRWYLGSILNEVNNWKYANGTFINKDIPNLILEISKDGDEMDFTTTSAFGVPIVSEKIKNALIDIQGVQFFDVCIKGKELATNYYVMIVGEIIDCVDEGKSNFRKFKENDPVRPDKAGQYQAFFKLVINPYNASEKDIFRLEKATTYLIVSERIKEIFEEIGATGYDLKLVSEEENKVCRN